MQGYVDTCLQILSVNLSVCISYGFLATTELPKNLKTKQADIEHSYSQSVIGAPLLMC